MTAVLAYLEFHFPALNLFFIPSKGYEKAKFPPKSIPSTGILLLPKNFFEFQKKFL